MLLNYVSMVLLYSRWLSKFFDLHISYVLTTRFSDDSTVRTGTRRRTTPQRNIPGDDVKQKHEEKIE